VLFATLTKRFLLRPNDARTRCSKPFDYVGACLAKLELIEEIDAKFEDEVEQKELSNLCDF